MLTAKVECGWGIAAEIEQRATGLIGFGGVGGETLEIVDFALIVDFVLSPRLFQDFDHLAGALVAKGAVFFLAGEIRRDDVHRQPSVQHVIERCEGAGQHDGLHFTAAHGSEQVDVVCNRGAARDKGQGVLADLVRRGAKDVAKALCFGGFDDLGTVIPAGSQSTVWHAEKLVIVRAKGGEPRDFGGIQILRCDRNNLHRISPSANSVSTCVALSLM